MERKHNTDLTNNARTLRKKMNLFIKADNFKTSFIIIFVADIALIVFGLQENTFNSFLIMAGVLTILFIVLWLFAGNEGLLIEDGKVFYKSFRKKYYDINEIAGLHIVKDQITLGGYSSIRINLKNKYKIIYLKDRDYKNFSTDDGIHDFYVHHSKHILFTTIYDERVIEYFKFRGITVTGETDSGIYKDV